MQSTLTVTDLLSSRGRVDILRVLWGVDAPLTAADVARRTRLTHPAASTALRALAAQRILTSSPAGRGSTYWLNRENVYVELMIDPVFRAELEIPEMMIDALRMDFEDLAVSAVLFGSYARGDQTRDSDVDLVVVTKATAAKQGLSEKLPVLTTKFRKVFGASLSVIAYCSEEARSLSERAPSLYDSLWREGLTIFGPDVEDWCNLGSG